MEQSQKPLELGDIVEQTVNLVVSTFTRSLIVSALFLTLPFIIVTITANDLFTTILALGQSGTAGIAGTEEWERLLPLITALIPFFLSTLIAGAGSMISQVAITQMAAGDLTNEPIGYATAIARTFDRKWFRSILATLIQLLAILCLTVAGGIAIAVLITLFGGDNGGAVSILLTVVFIGVLAGGMMFMMVMWNFSLEAVAIEDLTATDALRRSWAIVEGYWWRTLGILILYGIALQFITSIISIPFAFGTMWDVYKEFFDIAKAQNGQVNPHLFEQIQGAMGTGIGVGMAITTIVRLLIEPQYRTVMFFDLRARHTPVSEPSVVPTAPVPPAV